MKAKAILIYMALAMALDIITPKQAGAIGNEPAKLVKKVQDAVVQVVAIRADGFTRGSGFFIGTSGYLLTSRHVVQDANNIRVVINDGISLPAEIVKGPATDVDACLLKVPGEGYKTLPVVSNVESYNAEGEQILILGYPEGEPRFTVVQGNISGFTLLEGYRCLKTTALIVEGNSGGPVLNMCGEVIGVVWKTERTENHGFNYAISADEIQNLVTYVMKNKGPLYVSKLDHSGVIQDEFLRYLEKAMSFRDEGDYAEALDELQHAVSFLERFVKTEVTPPKIVGNTYINYNYGLEITNPVRAWSFQEIPTQELGQLPDGVDAFVILSESDPNALAGMFIMGLDVKKLYSPSAADILLREPPEKILPQFIREGAYAILQEIAPGQKPELVSETTFKVDGRLAYKQVVTFQVGWTPARALLVGIMNREKLIFLLGLSPQRDFNRYLLQWQQVIESIKFKESYGASRKQQLP